jgi:hypothetical protein
MNPRNLALTAALVLALTGVVAAKSAKSGALAAAGRTIAGPGTANAVTAAGETTILSGNNELDACVTAINVGSSMATVELSGTGSASIDLNPGETRALCREDMTGMSITCLGVSSDDSCSVEWRLDAA